MDVVSITIRKIEFISKIRFDYIDKPTAIVGFVVKIRLNLFEVDIDNKKLFFYNINKLCKVLGVFMKRFFMYCIVIIGTLFVGLSFYMFAKNNEVIESTVPQGETIYLNVGESLDIPINHTKKNKRTTIETKSDNSNVATVNSESGKIEAKSGGTATIVITPSNTNFGPFTFTIRIGDGSNENPYFISTAEQMKRIGSMDSLWTLHDSYEVVSNIDFKETWVDGKAESWIPIGNSSEHFSGNFNGGTKTISNLIIDESCTSDYVGLFGYVEAGAKIEKITLLNPQIKTSAKYVGAIAGYGESSITRCKIVGGEIYSQNEDAYVGGIVGVAARTQIENEISMCQIEKASISGNCVGGIAGKFVSGVISNCKVVADIASNKDIKSKYAGGLVGEISAKDFTQGEKSFTYNSLIQTNLVIATFGKNGEDYNATTNDVMIANDSLSGDAATDYVGNIFYSNTFNSTKAHGLTGQEIEDQSKYQYTKSSQVVSWDFSGTWSFDGKTETDSMGPYIIQDGVGQTVRPLRSGTEVDGSNIMNVINSLMEAGESDEKNAVLNYTYVIKEDISIDAAGIKWTPIGNVKRPFGGVIYGLDGAKLTINNVVIPSSKIVAYAEEGTTNAEKTAGIFGCTSSSAMISDIVVNGLIINSDENTIVGGIVGKNYGVLDKTEINSLNIKNGKYVGGIVGYNGGEVSHSVVQPGEELTEIPEGQTEAVKLDTKVYASGKSARFVGGVAGFNAKSIYCCKADVIVEGTSTENGSYVGGVVGNNAAGANVILSAKVGGNTQAGGISIRLGGVVGTNAGSVDRCYSELSAVTAAKNYSSYAGGIAGETQQGTITSSYFDGSLEGFYVGGLVGSNYGGTIEKSYSNASILASNKIGGLAYRTQGTIKNCYFNATNQIQFAEGNKKNNIFAGLTVDFPQGGYIQNCYVSTTQGVASNGDVNVDVKNEESKRSWIATLWREGVSKIFNGTLEYNIVNANGIKISTGDKIEKSGINTWTWIGGKDSLKFRTVNISGDGLLDGNIVSFFTSECKFDSTIWDFSGKTPKLFGLNLSGAMDEEFAEPVITYSLAEGTESNITLVGTEIKFTSFAESTTFTLVVGAENTDEVPAATLLEGDCIELGALADGKLEITVKAVGTAKIQLALTDGTTVDIIVTVE